MSLYNITNLTNANNMLGVVIALNDIVGGLVAYGILIILFVIPFAIINLRTGSPIPALGGASFFVAIMATLFLPLGLISLEVWQMIIVAATASVLVTILVGAR